MRRKRAIAGIAPLVAALTVAAGAVSGAASGKTRPGSSSCYRDAIGDAGDAPDISLVTIRTLTASVRVDIQLAQPTELGRYGWILFGFDTDRNPFTGGGRGDELLVLTNGEATTLARWIGGPVP